MSLFYIKKTRKSGTTCHCTIESGMMHITSHQKAPLTVINLSIHLRVVYIHGEQIRCGFKLNKGSSKWGSNGGPQEVTSLSEVNNKHWHRDKGKGEELQECDTAGR